MTPERLQTLLETGACDDNSNFARRVVAAREQLLATQGTAWADLVVLVRQALEHWATARQRGNRANAVVRVPSMSPWPSREQWGRASVVASTTTLPNRFRLECRPWTPDWLPEGDARVVEDAVAAVPRRTPSTLSVDALVARRMGLEHATCEGQRDAIRSAYLTPAGSNTLVVLPTGAGKSAVFQFAALHNSALGDGMVVVVVPTTALARDQEARYRELARRANHDLPVGVPLAFHGGLSDEERLTMRQAVANGALPILFASPESLLGTLQRPLLTAAQKGLLAVFAIDEAHIVAQWAEFRPHFQALSGFRDALRCHCPPDHYFRTLLLTATLTEEGFEILTRVFGPLLVVAETALRTEPAYLISTCADDAEKRRRIGEALYHLPRPLLLYTTLRDDAEEWTSLMEGDLGFRRVRCVRGGDMADETGAAILREWVSGEIDVVVATSAFGLGVDQSEVRSVVHACLPESIDRWYQEVGRSGRDGRASVALLVADAADRKTGERMAKTPFLRPDKAWTRWNAMRKAPRPTLFDDAYTEADHTISVALDTLTTGNDVGSQHTKDWNFRTLTMMVHAGMLDFSHALPRKSSAEVPDDHAHANAERSSTPYAHVTIVDTDHLDRDRFFLRFARARDERIAADEDDVARLRALVDGTQSVHELLRETYAIAKARITLPTTAGDCPKSRREGRARHDRGFSILLRPSDAPMMEVDGILLRAFRDLLPRDYFGPLLVRYHAASGWSFIEDLRELVGRLATLGVVEFAWPTSGFDALDWASLSARAPRHYVFAAEADDRPALRAWQVPRLSVLRAPDAAELTRTLAIVRPRHVVLVPEGLDDPHAPHRPFNARTHVDLPGFLERIRPR